MKEKLYNVDGLNKDDMDGEDYQKLITNGNKKICTVKANCKRLRYEQEADKTPENDSYDISFDL